MSQTQLAPQFWTAPAAVSHLRQNGGTSSWHVQPAYFTPGGTGRHIAGHFRLTGVGDALQGWPHGGRTEGRALRRLRRYLRHHPVSFG